MTEQGVLAAIEARLARLEAADAVRQVATRYFRLCDRLGPETRFDELGALFAADAEWEGRGRYRAAFGRHRGRAAIVAMLAGYADPPHFALNVHYLTSEAIVITGAQTASAQWTLLQASTYSDGRSDLRSAHLTLDFVVEEGAWRIARFITENLFSRDVGPWNDEAPISVPASKDNH